MMMGLCGQIVAKMLFLQYTRTLLFILLQFLRLPVYYDQNKLFLMRLWWFLLCTKPKRGVGFSSTSTQREQSIGKQSAPFVHRIITTNQSVLFLLFNAGEWALNWKAINQNFIVSGLTRPEIEITYPVLDMSLLTFTLQTRFYIYANLISFKYLTINMQHKLQKCKNKHNRGLSKLLELINPCFRQTFLLYLQSLF
jgi:hypothetical protein